VLFRKFSLEWIILSVVFFVSFAIQHWLWFAPLPYIDSHLWVQASEQFAAGTWPGFSGPIPPHPGTSIVLPTAGLILLGVGGFNAMQYMMAFLISSCIAAIVYLCRKLRPDSLWWLGVCAFLIPNPLYPGMSAPSALAALLACIYILIVLYLREKEVSRDALFWLGVCSGVFLATRVDTALSIMLFSLPYLWPLAGKRLFTVCWSAALFFGALNPFIWQDPILYVFSIVHQVNSNVATQVNFDYTLMAVVLPAIAFAFGLAAVYSKFRFTTVPNDFLKWLLAASALLCCVILSLKHHPIRYFFPIMMLWQMLLPLFLLELLSYFKSWKVLQPLRRSEYALVLLFVIPQIIAIYSLWIYANDAIFYHIVD
jgi:hypothetical protein